MKKSTLHISLALGFMLLGYLSIQLDAHASKYDCRRMALAQYNSCVNTCRVTYGSCLQTVYANMPKNKATKGKFYKQHNNMKACRANEATCTNSCKTTIKTKYLICKTRCQRTCFNKVKQGLFTDLATCGWALCGLQVNTNMTRKAFTPKDYLKMLKNKAKLTRNQLAAARKANIQTTKQGLHRRKKCFYRKCN